MEEKEIQTDDIKVMGYRKHVQAEPDKLTEIPLDQNAFSNRRRKVSFSRSSNSTER